MHLKPEQKRKKNQDWSIQPISPVQRISESLCWNLEIVVSGNEMEMEKKNWEEKSIYDTK